MNKALKYYLIYVGIVFVLSLLVLAGIDSNERLPTSGVDAFAIAASRPLYWVFVIAGILLSGLGVWASIKYKIAESGGGLIHFIVGGGVIILFLTIFVAPCNIKADPIGSAATTEQIKMLRDKNNK